MTTFNQEEYQKLVYKYKTANSQIKAEATVGYFVENIEINNGVFTHIVGMEYPEKGVVSTTDLFATNAVKKLIIETVKILKYLIPSLLVFIVLPFKFKVKILEKILLWFNTIAFRIISPSILQDQHLTPMAQELSRFSNNFLENIGINKEIREQTTEILINVINYDNAYRYRFQDLFNETTKGKLMNPRKELKRLLKINKSREVHEYDLNDPNVKLPSEKEMKRRGIKVEDNIVYSPLIGVSKKFKMFHLVLSSILLHPKIKKAFLYALYKTDITRLQPDKADRFWMCVRTGYQYFGMTHKQRLMEINTLKYCKPSKIEV